MTKVKALLIGAGAVLLISDPVSVAVAQSALTIGDNDSVLIDGNSFTVVPGKGKGGASTLITKLGAQALGPGAVVFRSGDKLYIAGTGPIEGVRLGSDRYGGSRNDYGSDRGDRGGIKIGPLGQCFDPRGCDDYGGSRNASDRYGGSRNDYGSDRYGGRRNDYGSDRYGGSRNDYGSDRYGGSRNDYGSDRYGGSRNDYGSDRYGGSRNDYGSDR